MKLNDLKDRRDELLQGLIDMSDAGLGEVPPDQFVIRKFLPLPEYGRVLDPQCLLVVGNRGAGKTQIFRAIQQQEGRQAIQQVAPRVDAEQLGNSRWLIGFSTEGQKFPASFAWSKVAETKSATELQHAWCALLLRILVSDASDEIPSLPAKLKELTVISPNELSRLHIAFDAVIEIALTWLDEVDRQLETTNRWLFVTYDDLDRITGTTWDDYQLIVQGLLQFWSTHARRWHRLRPKIFLRRDLFDRAILLGSDISKLNAQRVELTWTPRNLYAMLAKRVFNETDLFADYFTGLQPAGEQRGALGWFPTAQKVEAFTPMVEQLIGKHMGASHSKGVTFTWLPNHCMDANGLILPRSFLRLIGYAADQERQSRRAQWPQLIHPTSLRLSLDRVSDGRVTELGEEFPWMGTVQQKLKTAQLVVPIPRVQLARVLSLQWPSVEQRPPETSGDGLLRYLGMLGVFYEIPDGRINVRDIYLKGFGFKRKGGVARPL